MTSNTIPPEDEERRRHLLHLVWRLRNGDVFKALPSIEFDEIKQVAAELEFAATQPDREAIIEALRTVQLARLNGLFDAAIANQINCDVDGVFAQVDSAIRSLKHSAPTPEGGENG